MASLLYLHNKINGVTYVYSNYSYRDKENHNVRHDRKCIGHLDPDTGEVVPNRQRKVEAELSESAATCKVEDIGVSMLAENAASLCHAAQWPLSARTSFGGRLGDQRISELVTRITAEKQQMFFARWTGANYADVCSYLF